MKKFKKIIALGLTAMAVVSAMSMTASAKEIIDLEDGVQMILYDENDVEAEDDVMPLDVDNESFSVSVPQYSSYAWIYAESSGRNLKLDSGQSQLTVTFNNPTSFNGRIAMYDATSGNYLNGSSLSDALSHSYYFSKKVKYTGLTGGHTYRLAISGSTAFTLTGTILSE